MILGHQTSTLVPEQPPTEAETEKQKKQNYSALREVAFLSTQSDDHPSGNRRACVRKRRK